MSDGCQRKVQATIVCLRLNKRFNPIWSCLDNISEISYLLNHILTSQYSQDRLLRSFMRLSSPSYTVINIVKNNPHLIIARKSSYASFGLLQTCRKAFCAPRSPLLFGSYVAPQTRKFSTNLTRNNDISLSPSQKDTIYALSTPPGRAGVAVIRVSGPKAPQVYQHMVRAEKPRKKEQDNSFKPPTPWKMHRCSIIDPVTREVLDEGLFVYFAGEYLIYFLFDGSNYVN